MKGKLNIFGAFILVLLIALLIGILGSAYYKPFGQSILDNSGSLRPLTGSQIIPVELQSGKLSYSGFVGQASSDCEGAAGLVILYTDNKLLRDEFLNNYEMTTDVYWNSPSVPYLPLQTIVTEIDGSYLGQKSNEVQLVYTKFSSGVAYYGWSLGSNYPGGKPQAPCTWNYEIEFTPKPIPQQIPGSSPIPNETPVTKYICPQGGMVDDIDACNLTSTGFELPQDNTILLIFAIVIVVILGIVGFMYI